MKGTSADAGPHYHKLYGRVTNTCSNRRGQPKRSAMRGPHSGRKPLVIDFTSPSGKYELFAVTYSASRHQEQLNTCGSIYSFWLYLQSQP